MMTTGIMAAPNRSRITAKVLSVDRSPDWSDKWLLEIEIISSEPVEGPNFSTRGQRGFAFAIGDHSAIRPLCTIQADAEYIGDAHGGQWHLENLSVLE